MQDVPEIEDEEDRLEIVVPGTLTSGSLNKTEVAGTVLGVMNPELPGREVENTLITTAPVSPLTKETTSLKTTAF